MSDVRTEGLPKRGDVIDGKYTIERVIGEGGMGIVYEAIHQRLEQRVAIKMLLPEIVTMKDIVNRFEREARAAARLRGRHVARVIDVGETAAGLPFMVMEYLEGHDLSTEIESRKQLPVAESVDYLIQACLGMAEAHEAGIVHRDLKPANLFLARDRDGTIIKVLDFGISKIASGSSRSTSTEMTMGTPLYMSPEQIRSTRDVDARADIWSLGVILYELLAGVAPFEGAAASVGAAIVSDPIPPMSLHRQDVPAALLAVLGKALEKNREQRYATTRELADALVPFSSNPVPLPAPSAAHLQTRPRLASIDESAPTIALPGTPSPATSPGWTTAARSTSRTKIGVIVGGAVFALAALLVGVNQMRKPTASGTIEPTNGNAVASSTVPSSTGTSEPVILPAASAPSAAVSVFVSAPTAKTVPPRGNAKLPPSGASKVASPNASAIRPVLNPSRL